MTRNELVETAAEAAIEIMESGLPHWADTIGVRYDNRIVNVGDELECSVSNFDRDDSRDFPGYDPSADRMGGTSAYFLANIYLDYDDEDEIEKFKQRLGGYLSGKDEAAWDHCSIVIGYETSDVAEDDWEVVLSGCEVVKVLW